MENEERLRPLLVPVFDHLYNLYDSELEFYINLWEDEQKKEDSDKDECANKLIALYEEQRKREKKEKDHE